MMTESCIACSSPPTQKVVDGGFHKPVCDTHARLYSGRGYEIRPS